jgi:hypothetical protein
MKAKNLISTLLAALALTACGNDKETALTDNDGRVALQVTSGIQTRAYGNSWQPNDAIGIFMLKAGSLDISEGADNRRYTTADGSSAFSTSADQTIYFPIDGSKTDFVAFYPQQKLDDGILTLDMSDQTNLPAIDLLYAATKSTDIAPHDKNHPQVSLDFVHRLSKIELNISAGAGLQASDLTGLKVEITNQRTTLNYDILHDGYGLDLSHVQVVTLNTRTGGTFSQAIVLPNIVNTNPVVPGREFIFTLASGEVFRWSIPDDKLFGRGDRNIYNITLNRTGVEVTATISDWNTENGGNGDAY